MKRLVAVVLVALLAFGVTLSLAHPPAAEAESDSFSPPDRVYFPETGHTLSYGFLRYWHDKGGLSIFGYPISEEIQEKGLTAQYFERARFEYHPENPEPYKVLLGLLGTKSANDASPAIIHTMAANDGSPDQIFFPETGHTLSSGFKDYWKKNGGLPIFGFPISQEGVENGLTVQYFERARFEYHPENPEPYKVLLTQLGRAAAQADKINTSRIPRDPSIPVHSDDLWPKWIEVNLSTQTLFAHEGEKVVLQTLISSGLPGTPTPTGTFSILYRVRSELMTQGTPGEPGYYYLPNVPYTQYFADGGYAIHGTYWHNNFGNPMSRGCVNLTIPDAEWTWNWASVGTPVVIHY